MRTSRGPKLAALYLLAALLGAGSAWAVLRYATGSGEGTGPWRVSLLAGSADADAYTRARVAMTGLLALSRSETMYYVAMHDSAGGALRTRCRYRVSGRPPAARWWSITAYADDFFLIANPQRRYSVNGFSAVVDASGSFTLITEPNPSAAAGANVIPTPADRGLILALRLYNPAPGLAAAPASLDAPRIERLGPCR